MNLRGCQGCGICKRERIDCVLEDDLKPYWAQLHTADALAAAICHGHSADTRSRLQKLKIR